MADKNKDMEKNNTPQENTGNIFENENELNEDQRVKILSPGMLVVKRFIRNRLAIVGTVILIVMILFSFVGGALSPYAENQSFYKNSAVAKDYAAAALNKEPQFYYADGVEFENSLVKFEIINAVSQNKSFLKGDGYFYTVTEAGEGFYLIARAQEAATVKLAADGTALSGDYAQDISAELEAAFMDAITAGEDNLEFDGQEYSIVSMEDNTYTLCLADDIGVSTRKVVSLLDTNEKLTFEFMRDFELALQDNKDSFEYDGANYTVEKDKSFDIIKKDGNDFACVSDYSIQSTVTGGKKITIDEMASIVEAISEKKSEYTNPEGVVCSISNKDTQYTITTKKSTNILDTHSKPSSTHWLGTDKDGMDNLTRLMYGGRISLFIGFVVVIIELLIGVLLGGIAGYFGKWVDNLIMRIVDIVICIPSMPLYIILGSIMDTNKVDAQVRIFYLMFVLGILSWPGICRMVRGQILSLREQEFMIATEATGISVRRRIFKHLIPNVIPQLIVIATMDLGSIILTEATLSFLGLGVKFPYASWGNIINAVNDSYVMTHFWFEWIPAGFLILLTVLGFNFVGDGLRDAFDPKMKR